jgi:hypothetical protein
VTPAPSFEAVHAALVTGFHTATLSDGLVLTASANLTAIEAVSQANLPYLSFKTGSFTTVGEADPWESKISWDIPAELKVEGAAGHAGDVARRVIRDLFAITATIRGLPVTADGVLRPYGKNTAKYVAKNELTYLANRGGPYLRTVSVNPESADDPFAIAKLVFHVDFILQTEPERETRKVKVTTFGMNVLDLARQTLDWDVTRPYSVPQPALADTSSQTAHVEPAPAITAGGLPLETGLPEPVRLKGPEASKIVAALIVEPAVKTLAALATQQLQAIAVYQDRSTGLVTPNATYASSDDTKATVSSGGLVTAVASGSATITVTYEGVTGTCRVTVS